MFFRLENKKLTKNDLVRKINFQLTSNFFTLEDFKDMSKRKARKIIKLIAKQQNLKLSRGEANLIASSLREIKKNEYHAANFFIDAIETIYEAVDLIKLVVFNFLNFIFIYRKDRKKILRI